MCVTGTRKRMNRATVLLQASLVAQPEAELHSAIQTLNCAIWMQTVHTTFIYRFKTSSIPQAAWICISLFRRAHRSLRCEKRRSASTLRTRRQHSMLREVCVSIILRLPILSFSTEQTVYGLSESGKAALRSAGAEKPYRQHSITTEDLFTLPAH